MHFTTHRTPLTASLSKEMLRSLLLARQDDRINPGPDVVAKTQIRLGREESAEPFPNGRPGQTDVAGDERGEPYGSGGVVNGSLRRRYWSVSSASPWVCYKTCAETFPGIRQRRAPTTIRPSVLLDTVASQVRRAGHAPKPVEIPAEADGRAVPGLSEGSLLRSRRRDGGSRDDGVRRTVSGCDAYRRRYFRGLGMNPYRYRKNVPESGLRRAPVPLRIGVANAELDAVPAATQGEFQCQVEGEGGVGGMSVRV